MFKSIARDSRDPKKPSDRGSGVKPASAIRRTEQQILDDVFFLWTTRAMEIVVLKYVNRQKNIKSYLLVLICFDINRPIISLQF